MRPNEQPSEAELTGVDDVRLVRQKIADLHGGDLTAHVAETNRIAEEVRAKLRLGPVISPPAQPNRRIGANG